MLEANERLQVLQTVRRILFCDIGNSGSTPCKRWGNYVSSGRTHVFKSKVEASIYYSKDQMKGLTKFIMDIRLCKSREAEIKRINKELANIRNKFRTEKNIDGYHRKKYIAKLIFIFLLGYDVNIGHSEAIFLLASNKQSEKQIGYLYLSLLSNPDDEDNNHVLINSIISDLRSLNYYSILLATNSISFFMTPELVDNVGPILNELIINTSPTNIEYHSFLLCYLAFIKYDPQYFSKHLDIVKHLVRLFPNASEVVLLPLTNVIYEGALINPDLFASLCPDIISRIAKLCKVATTGSSVYYNIPSPWAIVKLLQLLQLLQCPEQYCQTLSNLMLHIFSMENSSSVSLQTKRMHYNNILNAIKFEAVNVASSTPVNRECLSQVYVYLSKMLDSVETNVRFLSLESLVRMKHTPTFGEMIREFSVKLSDLIATEKNSSLRLQAVSVIYSIGDLSNTKEIVENMVKFLIQAELCIRQELVLKICTIASKNISDTKWYIDSMISVLNHGRDFTGEDAWFKVVQTVSTHPDIQEYAVKSLLAHLNSPNCPENVVKLGVYLIGEYGHLIQKQPSTNSQSQYNLVIGLFPFHTSTTKIIILTALVKMAYNQPTLKQQILNFFSDSTVCQNIDNEIQQRACEYKQMLTKDNSTLAAVLDTMPPYEYDESDSDDDNDTDHIMDSVERFSTASKTSVYSNEQMQSATKTDDYRSEPNIADSMMAYSHGGITNQDNSDSQLRNAQFLANFALSNQGVLYDDNRTVFKLSSFFNKKIGSHDISMESADPYVHLKIVMISSNPHDSVSFSSFSPETVKTYSGGCTASFKTLCVCPFSTYPSINVSYLTSTNPQLPINISLILPINITTYMEPYKVDPSNFTTTWNSMSSPELESVEVFESSRIFDSSHVFLKLKALNMEILSGIDANPNNFVTASALYSQNVVAGCITRLETKLGSATMRLTVRTNCYELTSAVSSVMKSFI